MKKIILAVILLQFNISYAQTVDLVCKGKESVYTINKETKDYKRLFETELEFELAFNEKNQSMSATGIYLCNEIGHNVVKEKLIIDKKRLHYTCTSKRDEIVDLSKIDNFDIAFSLSRLTGKLKLDVNGIAKDQNTYREGRFNCEKASAKF